MKIKLKNEFYDYFEGYYIFEVDEIISSLSLVEQKQVIMYFREDSIIKNNAASNRLIRKIKRKLNEKYKMNIYKKYYYIDRKILDSILITLTEKELIALKREYTLEEKSELKEPLTKKEKKETSRVISKINKIINEQFPNIKVKINNRKYKSFFSLFPGYTKEEVMLVVRHLEEKDYKLLTKKYGDDFKNTKIVPELTLQEENDINTRILLNIRRRLKRIREGANYYTISTLLNVDIKLIKERLSLLNKEEKEKLFKMFGENLDREVLLNPKNNIISKRTIKKLTYGPKHNIIASKPSIPFYQRFIMFKLKEETTEDFFKRVNSCISSKYLPTLTRIYGSDLLNCKIEGTYTAKDTERLDRIIIPMIKYRLKKLENFKTLKEYFASFITLEDLFEGINDLSQEEIDILKDEFGPELDQKRSNIQNEREENIKIARILRRLESIIYNNIGKRIKIKQRFKSCAYILKEIKNLTESSEFEYLLSTYSYKEALAIIVKLNMEGFTNKNIFLLTGVEENKITELTISYLVDKSWVLQNNNVKTRLLKK